MIKMYRVTSPRGGSKPTPCYWLMVDRGKAWNGSIGKVLGEYYDGQLAKAAYFSARRKKA